MEMSRPSGGTPMVKIDGAKVRSLREAQGLTQLFLATTVEVTTDTISRWENKRYPTIKKENGLKLAEILGVELVDILECEDEQQEKEAQCPVQEPQVEQADPPPPLSAPESKSRFGLYAIVFGVLVAFLFWWFSVSQDQIHVSARRLLPSQAVPGQPFPVAITLSTESSEPVAMILTETLPKGAELLSAVPSFSAYDKEKGELKWLRKINGNQIFAYRITVHQQPGTAVNFFGTVARRKKIGQPISVSVKGNHGLSMADVHWADRDSDGVICDEEILTLYDVFSEIEGLGIDIDQVEEIWLGSGYVWNSESGKFDIKN